MGRKSSGYNVTTDSSDGIIRTVLYGFIEILCYGWKL